MLALGIAKRFETFVYVFDDAIVSLRGVLSD
jgi:hypothetical protein